MAHSCILMKLTFAFGRKKQNVTIILDLNMHSLIYIYTYSSLQTYV